jgi:hypothetical protein
MRRLCPRALDATSDFFAIDGGNGANHVPRKKFDDIAPMSSQ